MEILEHKTRAGLQNWRFLESPPLPGAETMRLDADILNGIEKALLPPTVRFFRFNSPTVSYGCLQKRADVSALVPLGWDCVQRPTGGGVVLHNGDLCLSLCWSAASAPLPMRAQDQYRWIHSVVLEALSDACELRLAACDELPASQEPFAQRSCFNNPVGCDLLLGQKKIVGGALRCTRRATLYQGSIQMRLSADQERRLFHAFHARLVAF